MIQVQLDKAKSLEGATLPDGTKHTSKPEPVSAEAGTDNAAGQPDQPDGLETDEVNRV